MTVPGDDGKWYFRLTAVGKIHFSTEFLMETKSPVVHSVCGREGKTSECYFHPVNPIPRIRHQVCKFCLSRIEAIAVAEKMGEP